MKKKKITNRIAAFYLLAALVLPTFQPVFGASSSQIADVGLTRTGALVGQVIDSQGKPVANSPVEISATGRAATEVTTNEQGYFSVAGLSAGIYVAATPKTAKMVRVWAPRTAPPAASQGVLLVESAETARAQNKHSHVHGAHQFLKKHCVKIAIGAAIAGGIVAIAQNDAS